MNLRAFRPRGESRLSARASFANHWVVVLFLPGALLPFKSGPFAWNVIIGFWVGAFAFFGWILMMGWARLRAIHWRTWR